MPPGSYGHAIGGKVVLSENGRLNVAGTEFLAGATRPLIADVTHVIDQLGLPLATAWKMASENPGRFAGGRGVLEVGAAADLLRFAWQGPGHPIAADMLVIGGSTVFNAD